ncbi:MAG: flagellar hook capping FlgD N-terminal domain-containing protein [Janthinobacterium lividum]
MSITPIQGTTQPTSIASPVASKAAAASSSTTGSSSTDVSNLGGTFLQLLTQELQNQDPTAPMDSTQMVGQMISLNQLQQLASINQTLTKSAAAAVPAA